MDEHEIPVFGSEGPQTMAEEWTGTEWIAAIVMENEHARQDRPTHLAWFQREFPSYTETMWIAAFPHVRLIIVGHPPVDELPGVVRELPLGWRDLASEETVRAKFASVVHTFTSEHGWQPWDRG